MYPEAMDYLNFHHLRYFWTVARKGGVRKAAEELGVSQPSISAQLKVLEEALGEKLFRRSGPRTGERSQAASRQSGATVHRWHDGRAVEADRL
jgi:DNA-binding transcriptional LysR family regulator